MNTTHRKIVRQMNAIPSAPEHVPYGNVYTATLIIEGVVFTKTFKYNPNTYTSEGMSDIIKELVIDSGVITEDFGFIEIAHCTLDYLLNTPDSDLPDGLAFTSTGCRIPLSAVRYTSRTGKKAFNFWKHIDNPNVIVINIHDTWVCSEVDNINTEAQREWAQNSLVTVAANIAALEAFAEELRQIK